MAKHGWIQRTHVVVYEKIGINDVSSSAIAASAAERWAAEEAERKAVSERKAVAERETAEVRYVTRPMG